MNEEKDSFGLIFGKYARLYTQVMGETRCQIIGKIQDPDGNWLLNVMLPGKVECLIPVRDVLAYTVFESLEKLEDMVAAEQRQQTQLPQSGIFHTPDRVIQP